MPKFKAANFWLLFFALTFVNLLPIWCVAWLPMGDVGGHVELMDIAAKGFDSNSLYAITYEWKHYVSPNVISLYVAKVFAGVIDSYEVARILVSLFVLGIPLGLLALARAFDRSPWQSLLGFPLVYGAIFNVGMLNYMLSIPVLLFTWAMCRKTAQHTSWKNVLFLSALWFLLFLCHAITLSLGVSLGILIYVLSVPRKQNLWGLVAGIPLLLPTGRWFYEKWILNELTDAGRDFSTLQLPWGFYPRPIEAVMAEAHGWSTQFFVDNSDELMSIGLIFCWLLTWIGTRPKKSLKPQSLLTWIQDHALWIVWGATMVAYFFYPWRINEVIAERLIYLVVLVTAILPWRTMYKPVRRLFVVSTVVLSVVYAGVCLHKFRRFNRELIGDLPALIASLPDESRMAYVMWFPGNPITHMGPLKHLPKAMHSIYNSGITGNSFAVQPYTPIQYRKDRTPHNVWGHFWKKPGLREWDFVLLYTPWKPVNALSSTRLHFRKRHRSWWLFEVKR